MVDHNKAPWSMTTGSTPGLPEQIKERVRSADQDRIAKRADAAATAKLQERENLVGRLAALDAELTTLIARDR